MMSDQRSQRNAAARQHLGSDERAELNQLVPGVTIRRYTTPAPRGRLDTNVPCCGRTARLPRGSDCSGWSDALVACTVCRLVFDVTLIDELDGGHAAMFQVRNERIVLARKRRTTAG